MRGGVARLPACSSRTHPEARSARMLPGQPDAANHAAGDGSRPRAREARGLTLGLQGAWAETAAVSSRRRRILLVGATIVAALAVAIPVMGADPSPSAGPPGQTKPDKSPHATKPDKAAKAGKGAEVAVTVVGTVTKGHRRERPPDVQLHRRRQDVAAVGRPELVLGRQEPAQRLRRQVGLDRRQHARR